MNNISALKKSAAAIALVLGVTPMGAHAWLSDAKMIAHWPLNEGNNPEANRTPDGVGKKCPGTVASGVTFTPAPTGVDATAVQPWTEYEAIPAPPSDGRPYPRYTQVATIGTNTDGTKNITVQDKSPATCVGIAAMDIAPAYSISAWVKTDSDAPSGATVIERGTSWQLTVGPAEDVDPTTDMTPTNNPLPPANTDPSVPYNYAANTNPYALHPSGRYYKQPVSFCAKGAATEYPTPTTPTTMAVAKASGVQRCLKGYMSTPHQPQIGSGTAYYGTAGNWHNIIVTYAKVPPVVSGATQPQARLYIDGVQVAASERPDPLRKHTAPFPQPEKGTLTTIGKRFQGKLDDIRLYNIALSPDDITELAYGCRPATFDPKTGKVSIPCVVEGTTATTAYYPLNGSGNAYNYLNSYNVGAWTADLLALPPVKTSGTVGGETGRNLVFNVAAAKLLPVPVGAPPAMPAGYRMDGRWYSSEYPWGVFVARYSSTGEALMDEDIYSWEGVMWSTAQDYDLADAILQIPAVTVPSPLGLPVKDCYSAKLYYSVNYNRFYMSYTDVDSQGANCGIGTPPGAWYGTYSEDDPVVVEEVSAPDPEMTP